jgi:hypothetical protein
MPKFNAPLDLSRAELRNAVTQNLGTAPSSPVAGLRYYDTVSHLERFWNGSAWVNLSDVIDVAKITGLGTLATLNAVGSAEITNGSIVDIDINAAAAIALSKLATDPLARANHTGTQLASTVSNFDTQVRTSRLDQMTTPTATVSFGGQTISSVATPTNPTDAANMAYVDSVAMGLDIKAACRVAATAITVASPGATIDGVTMATGNRVLRMAGDATSGIYIWNGAAVPMTRATDADTSAEVRPGMFTFVAEGTVNADKGFVLTTDAPITLGTTPLAFTQFSGSGSVTGTTNRITVSGGQVDIAATYVGQASLTTLGTITTGTWTATTIAIANGGTGATTAAGARAALGTIGKYTTLIGNGSATTFTVTHSLASTDVGVELYDVATGQTVYADVTRTTTNAVVIDGFVTAPTTNALGVVVWG